MNCLPAWQRRQKPTCRYFLRGDVIAVALITLCDQPEKAVRFWTAAAEDDGLRNGRP